MLEDMFRTCSAVDLKSEGSAARLSWTSEAGYAPGKGDEAVGRGFGLGVGRAETGFGAGRRDEPG
jgi:hypothetical protein